MHKLLKPALALSLACAALAVTFAQGTPLPNVAIDTVRYPSGGADIETYIARPKTKATHPGVIVIHDSRGLDEHTRSVAQRLAASGFVAFAPDLLSRAGGTAAQKAGGVSIAINRIPLTAYVADLTAGLAFLQKTGNVDAARISVVALGWGGWRGFMLAARTPTLHRVVVFGGATPMDGIESIQAPVLAHYGQFDFRNAASAVWTGKRIKRFTYHVYPEASAASFDSTTRRYDDAVANLAWTRTLEFLQAR